MPLPPLLRVLPRYLNPILRPVAGHLPPLAVLHHTGRKSGHPYASPVQAYPVAGGYIAAYAYSDNPQWAQNLLASGEGNMTRGGKHYAITTPRHLGDEELQLLPKPVAAMMRGIGVHSFLQFDATATARQ
jgi:deazaflavin-dependent oxidoreductase (nitroreductase family)